MRKETVTTNSFSKFFATYNWRPPAASLLALGVLCLEFGASYASAEGAYFLSRYLYGAFLAIALVALWLPSSQRQSSPEKPPVWWWADVMVCTYAIVPILQYLIPSPRPPDSPIDQLLGVPIGGWPSGHQVSMFGLAWVLMVARPQLAWPAFALAVVMGWARLASHAHYPFQVISGALLGLALGWWTTTRQNGLLLPRAWNGLRGLMRSKNKV